MPVPDSLASRNTYDVVCDSGLELTIQLLNGRDFIFTGKVPLPVLERMRELENAGETEEQRGTAVLSTLSDGERKAWYDYQCDVVSRSILKAKGEDVALAPDELGWLTDEEFNQVFSWATRGQELPKA